MISADHSAISKLERGVKGYKQHQVELLARAFNLAPARLLYGDPNDPLDPYLFVKEIAGLSDKGRRILMKTIQHLKDEAM